MVTNKCKICGIEWKSHKKCKWCSGNCWNKAHRERMKEAMDNFLARNHTHFQGLFKKRSKWLGTIICPKCNRKGRLKLEIRIYKKTQHKTCQLQTHHYKNNNHRFYDCCCTLGQCDEEGNLIEKELDLEVRNSSQP